MNLLPQKEKMENQREYFYRFSTVLAGALAVSLLIGGGLLLPSYFLGRAKLTELKINLASLKNPRDGNDSEMVSKILETAAQRVDFLLAQPNLSLTAAAEKITNKKPTGVQINGLSYHPQEAALSWSAAIALTGIANSREMLVAFVKALQTESIFTDINVPVSNFAKDRNIEFSLTIIQNEK